MHSSKMLRTWRGGEQDNERNRTSLDGADEGRAYGLLKIRSQ